MRKSLLLLLLLFLIITHVSCNGPGAAESYEATRFLLDTMVTVKAYGSEAKPAVEAAYAKMESLSSVFDRYNSSGPVGKINSLAGTSVQVPRELMDVLLQAAAYSQKTKGRFDVTVGPLTDLWRSKESQGTLPSQAELKQAVGLVDYRKLELDLAQYTVKLSPGMSLDLGGVAKGYIVDQAMQALVQYQVTGAVINAGGNVLTWGNHPRGEWHVGITDPQAPSQLLNTIKFKGAKAVVSAGNYERYYSIDGKTYGHILDTKTGWPADKVAGVTVVGESSLEADLLATAAFVEGVNQGLALIENVGYEGLIVDKSGKVHSTSGLKKYLTGL